jgi:hypothetical protein
VSNTARAAMSRIVFASDMYPGYGSGWKAFHYGERYDERYLVALNNSGKYGSAGFARGYRAATKGLGMYDEFIKEQIK